MGIKIHSKNYISKARSILHKMNEGKYFYRIKLGKCTNLIHCYYLFFIFHKVPSILQIAFWYSLPNLALQNNK